MTLQVFLDPFGVERNARDQESQITARNTRTSMDLFTMQQQVEQMRNRQAYLKEVQQQEQQSRQPPPPQQGQGQQQPPPQLSASDMILKEIGDMDKRIASAAKFNQLDEQDKLFKLREQALGRYSLAKNREIEATDRIDKQRKENVAAVSRFASGANTILNDDKVDPSDKRQQLEELEAGMRDENPQAYKILAAGQPKIDWADPRTWNRMKGLEQQAITPEKRVDMAIAKQNAETRAKSEQDRARNIDRLIAASRDGGAHERLPVGKKWVDPQDHSQGMEDIPDRSAKASTPAAKDADGKALTGEAFLNALPEDRRGLIKGIAEGRINPTTLSMRKTGAGESEREIALKQVLQYKPGYNQRKFPIYQAVEKDFTSGVAARNVTAINTAIHHMGTMYEAGEALKNNDTQAINRFTNAVATQLGDPRINNFKIASSAVANELMRVFRQVGASESETKDWESKFKDAQSPEQIREGIRMGAKLLRGRIEAVDEQWKRGMDSKEGYPDLLSPKSQRVIDKIGVKVRDDPEKAPTKKGGAMSLEDYIKSQEVK